MENKDITLSLIGESSNSCLGVPRLSKTLVTLAHVPLSFRVRPREDARHLASFPHLLGASGAGHGKLHLNHDKDSLPDSH